MNHLSLFFNDSATALVSGQEGAARSTPNRALHVNLRNQSGTEIGTVANPVQITGTVTTLSGVSVVDAAAWTAGTSNFTPMGGVFNDSATALTSGQQGTVRLTSTRAMHVSVDNATLAVTQSGFWTVTANAGTNLNTSALALDTSVNGLLLGQASTTSGQKGPLIQGAVTTAAPSYTTAQTSPLSLTTAGLLRVDASGTTVPVSGTFWQATQPVSGTVTANQGGAPWSENITQFGGVTLSTGVGASGTGIPRVTVSNDSNILATQSGTWTVQQGTPPWQVAGTAAQGAAVSGNPLLAGGRVATSYPTAAANGQASALMTDKAGRLVTVGGGGCRDLLGVVTTSVSGSAETTIVAAGGVGVFNDIVAIWITNTGANGVTATIKDGTGGTTRWVRNAGASSDCLPVEAFDCPVPQAVANANWTVTCAGTTPSVIVTVLYVKNQ